MKFLNFFENLGSKLGSIFKIMFTIFAGIVLVDALMNVDTYTSYIYLVQVILLYGFPVLVLWSGILGGEKTAKVLIIILVSYHLISRCLGSFTFPKWIDREGYTVYNLYSLIFDIARNIGIGAGFMFVCSLVFKNSKLFKSLGTIFALVAAALFVVVWVLIFLMVFKVGEVSFKWTNIFTILDTIFVYPFLISAFFAYDGKKEETKEEVPAEEAI